MNDTLDKNEKLTGPTDKQKILKKILPIGIVLSIILCISFLVGSYFILNDSRYNSVNAVFIGYEESNNKYYPVFAYTVDDVEYVTKLDEPVTKENLKDLGASYKLNYLISNPEKVIQMSIKGMGIIYIIISIIMGGVAVGLIIGLKKIKKKISTQDKLPPKPMNKYKIMFLIPITFLLFAILGIGLFTDSVIEVNKYGKIEAVCVDNEPFQAGNYPPLYYPIYKYTVDGITYQSKNDLANRPAQEIGKAETIYYLKSDPNNITVKKPENNIAISALGTLVFTTLSIIYFIYLSKIKNKQLKLQEEWEKLANNPKQNNKICSYCNEVCDPYQDVCPMCGNILD